MAALLDQTRHAREMLTESLPVRKGEAVRRVMRRIIVQHREVCAARSPGLFGSYLRGISGYLLVLRKTPRALDPAVRLRRWLLAHLPAVR